MVLNLPAEKAEEDEELEEEDVLFDNEGLSTQLNKDSLQIRPVLQWHFSKVLGLEWDKKEKFLISISKSGKIVFSGEAKDKDFFDQNSEEEIFILKEVEVCHQIKSACIDTENQLIFLGIESGPLVVLCYSSQCDILEIGSYNLLEEENIRKMNLAVDGKLLICQFGERHLMSVRNSWKNVFEELRQFQNLEESKGLLVKMTEHVKNIKNSIELEFLGTLKTEEKILDFTFNPEEVEKLELMILLEGGNLVKSTRSLKRWMSMPEVVKWEWTLNRLKEKTELIHWMGRGKVLGTDLEGMTTLYSMSANSEESRVQDEFETAELTVKSWEIQQGVMVAGTEEGSVQFRKVFEESEWREKEECKCLELEVDVWGMSGGEVSLLKMISGTNSVYITGEFGQMVVFKVRNSFWEKGDLDRKMLESGNIEDTLGETDFERTNTFVRHSRIIRKWMEHYLEELQWNVEKTLENGELGRIFQTLPVCFEDQEDYSKLVKRREREEVQFKREAIEKDLLDELEGIQEAHRELLKENKKASGEGYVTEREIAVDIALRSQIEEEGENEREKLKKKHENKLGELQHMRKVLKETCWEGMDRHKRSVTGIGAKVVVFNFGLKQEKKENSRKVKMGKWFSRMESLEMRLWKMEGEERESPGENFKKVTSEYLQETGRVVNGNEGREPAVQMNFEKRSKELMEYLEEERSKEQAKLSKQSKGLGTKKRGYEIQRRRRVKRKNMERENENESERGRKSEYKEERRKTRNGEQEGKSEEKGEIWREESEMEKEQGPWFWLDSGVGLRGETQKKRAIWLGEWMVRELKKDSMGNSVNC